MHQFSEYSVLFPIWKLVPGIWVACCVQERMVNVTMRGREGLERPWRRQTNIGLTHLVMQILDHINIFDQNNSKPNKFTTLIFWVEICLYNWKPAPIAKVALIMLPILSWMQQATHMPWTNFHIGNKTLYSLNWCNGLCSQVPWQYWRHYLQFSTLEPQWCIYHDRTESNWQSIISGLY